MSDYDDNFNDNSLDPKWTKDVASGVTLDEVGSEIKIVKDGHNKYGHIEQACSHDNITAVVKLKLASNVNITDWAPCLALYWDVDNWAKIILRYHKTTASKRFIHAIWNVNSTKGYQAGSQGVTLNTYYWVKIVLTDTDVKFYSSTNGTTWALIHTLGRPASFSGAPSLFILGNGESDSPSFPNTDFDNSTTGTDSMTCYVDEFTVEVPYIPPKVVLNLGLPGNALTTFSASKGDTMFVL